MTVLRVVRFVDRLLLKIETVAIVVVLTVMCLLAIFQVVMKLFGSNGIQWFDEFVRYLVVWIGLLGGMVAAHGARHINIDLLTRFFGPVGKRVIGVGVCVAAAGLTLVLLRISLYYLDMRLQDGAAAFAIEHAGEESTQIPEWWFVLGLPIGFGVMAWHFLAHAIYQGFGTSREETPAAAAATPGGAS